MKSSCLTLFVFFLLTLAAYPGGAAIINGPNKIVLHLDSTKTQATVESQISTTITTQYFTNQHPNAQVTYAFPLNENASAVRLRWYINGDWHTASVAGTPQDTTLPGGDPHPDIIFYLGKTPLYFSIPQPVSHDSTLIVELTYVELLPYKYGKVTYDFPGDYHYIQSGMLPLQELLFNLSSPRTIDSIWMISAHPVQNITNSGNSASVSIRMHEQPAEHNFAIGYALNSLQLGLFGYSSFQPDTLVPDSLGRGFFTFIAEPPQSSTAASINKVFTLIIDRSGSMAGDKMLQAKSAASFIVSNLNEGDMFNLIDFDDIITSFRPAHIPFNPTNRDAALFYISTLSARGMTDISGAFSVAVPQFASANDSTANIIIFFTDGEATVGITNTELLVNHIDQLIQSTETNIFLFSFGIGSYVNNQLLTLISSHNNGIAEFLGNDELYSRITDFYLTIRNPVLLNSQVNFNPPVISQVFPEVLPNLYKGKQMILAGRYSQPASVQVTLSGEAFGQPVSYQYTLPLAEIYNEQYQFLPKIWAKRKIETLLIQYYSLNPNSPEALAIKNEIIAISQAYGVITVFTSFTGGGGTDVESDENTSVNGPASFELLGNYPNPFNSRTVISIRIHAAYSGPVSVRIYNSLGQLVRILYLNAKGEGVYSLPWDGMGEGGMTLSSGVYFYGIEIENMVLVGKMNMIK